MTQMSEGLINTIIGLLGTAMLGGIGYLIKKYFFEKSDQPVPLLSSSEISQQESNMNNNIYEVRERTKILFIDDDITFQTAKVLKNMGWKNTKIIKDCKNLNSQDIQETDVFFVDINGVGVELNFTDQGLGLAAAIKKKYPAKKVVIYSAEKTGNQFHEAWKIIDDRLPKEADPYQFENTLENLLEI